MPAKRLPYNPERIRQKAALLQILTLLEQNPHLGELRLYVDGACSSSPHWLSFRESAVEDHPHEAIFDQFRQAVQDAVQQYKDAIRNELSED